MNILNPLQINDWNIKKFLITILSIQLMVWGLLGLTVMGIQVNVLSQIILFVYITFIPGFLILRILKLHNLGNIKTILFVIGISLFFIMLMGLLIDYFFPIIGIYHPISLYILMPILSVLTLILSVLSYFRDAEFNNPSYIDIKSLFSNTFLFLFIIIILSIISTYIMNTYSNNILQMILLALIALIPIMVILNWIPEKYHSFTVFAISLSLLFHTSLISNYIWGMDINHELFVSNIVIQNSYWDPSTFTNVNSMLSITILAPIYSLVVNLSLVWVFKIIYPFIFAFVPLGLFYAFQRQVNSKIAFLSVFFFVSFFIFYAGMPGLARQEIAELFLVLLIILITDRNMTISNLSFLSILFGFGIIISHYGTAYILILIILLGLVLRLIISLLTNFNYSKKFVILNNLFPIVLIIFTIIWFIYTSSSANLTTGVSIGNTIVNSISDLFNPSHSQALTIAMGKLPIFQSFERYMDLACQFFILIGILSITFKLRETKLDIEFYLLSIAALIIDIFGFIVPSFANQLNSDRLYQITLFFLAPFLLLGIINVYELVLKLLRIYHKFDINKFLIIISVFLAIYILFNSAFIYQLFDQPKMGRFALDNTADWVYLNNNELTSMIWLNNYININTPVYSDFYKLELLYGIIGNKDNILTLTKTDITTNNMGGDYYIYVGTYFTKTNDILVLDNSSYVYLHGNYFDNNSMKIYDIKNAWIYLKQ